MNIFSNSIKYGVLIGSFAIMACSSVPDREGTIKIIPSADKSHIDVAATVYDQPLIFMLDTGAEVNLINMNKGLKDIIAKGNTKTRYSFIGENKVVSFEAKTKVDELEEQTLVFHYSPDYKSNLLSTRSYLSKKIIFNFKENLIQLGSKKEPCTPSQRFRVLRKSLFLIRLSFSNQKIWFLWDTGADNSYIDLKWAKENFALKKLPQSFSVHAGYNASKNVSSYVELNTTLEDNLISGTFPVIDLSGLENLSPDIKGVIGLKFILKKNWFFDLDSKKFCTF